jgi:hypothetical protein
VASQSSPSLPVWIAIEPRLAGLPPLRAGWLARPLGGATSTVIFPARTLLWTVFAFPVSFLFYVYGSIVYGRAHRGLAGLYLDFFATEKPLLTTVIVVAPLVLYDILKFSHRIAGPLYGCRRVMRDMAAGKAVAGIWSLLR